MKEIRLTQGKVAKILVLDASYQEFRDDRIISRFSNHVPEFYVWNHHHKIPPGLLCVSTKAKSGPTRENCCAQ
jgi:hypothetical protein